MAETKVIVKFWEFDGRRFFLIENEVGECFLCILEKISESKRDLRFGDGKNLSEGSTGNSIPKPFVKLDITITKNHSRVNK